MADEATDSSNNEQLALCHRWVDHNFEAHENFMGIHKVENIRSDTLVTVLKDILRLNMPLPNCYGKCYHRASNMTEIKRAVGTQIQ